MDIYYEQNVGNPNIDKKRNKGKTLTVVRYILLAAGVVVLYLTFMMILVTDISKGWLPVIMTGIFGVLLVVPFVVAFFMIGRYINHTNMEFDYLLNNGMFRIIKIINRKKRKKMLELDISSIESIGRLDSENYDRYAQSKENKKQFAVCNYEEEDKIVYIYYTKEGVRYLLHIEPNEEMMIAIRRSVPRISILDKSMSVKPVAKPVSGQSGGKAI